MDQSLDQLLTGLSFYIPMKQSKVAHFVRRFPDTGEVYIFCNRYMGKPAGTLYSPKEYDEQHSVTSHYPLCGKCQAAIEGSIERISVLQGLRPTPSKAGEKNIDG